MKISIILTAYKEAESVKKAIQALIDPNYSGFTDKVQLIQISPDKGTLDAGKKAFIQISNKNAELVQIEDPGKGKPHALNLGLKKIIGEIVIFTDGDIYFGKNAVALLVKKFKQSEKIGGVTGRPVSSDPRNYQMGYYGHLFADANHYRRMIDLTDAPLEKGKFFVKKHKFFPMSGYIMAIRKNLLNFELPEDTLVDDAYLSYQIFNKDFVLAYEPEAKAFIKYPKTLKDYYGQKKRSTGGYIQLWKYGIVKEETKSRSPWHEFELFWFPFKYAENIREFLWSILLLPIRAFLWLQIIYDQKIAKKDFSQIWTRVESTK